MNSMNNITSITRNKIFSFIVNEDCVGLSLNEPFLYYGNLNCPDFLSRLYNLHKLPSFDSRVENAYDDIYRHTVTNPTDYEYGWLFTDARLPLIDGSDEDLLRFLCEMFHPEVRNNRSNWRLAFSNINELIKADGYEFFIKQIISNTAIYGWRRLNSKFSSLKQNEVSTLMNLFNRGGYVLNFSNQSFNDFTLKTIGLKLVEYYGLSKGKSLQYFVDEAQESYVIKLFIALFDAYMQDTSYAEERKEASFQHNKEIIDRWKLGVTAYVKMSENLDISFSSEYIREQISIMMKMTAENPTEAIGKAKELIESCCKTILEERNLEVPKGETLGKLTKKVMGLMKVTPENINDRLPAATAMKAILGNLSGIAEHMATLRNSYGSGHGKSASYKGLEERHAKLAVGSSITLVDFLWETHKRTLPSSHGG